MNIVPRIVMFRIALTLYQRRSSQLMTYACSRRVVLSCYSRFSDTVNFRDFSQAQKCNDDVGNLVMALKKNPHRLQIADPLKSCSSVEEVLEYLRNNPEIDSYLYRYVFYTILELLKSSSTELSAEEICRSEEFETFTKNVQKNVHFLKVEDTARILKVLISLGISTNSPLCQSMLQSIDKRVRRLPMKTILFLDSFLDKCSPSPVVDSLKVILPVVFETEVRSRLNTDDIRTLVDAVCFAFRRRSVSVEIRELLVDAALENVVEFRPSDAVVMAGRLTFTDDDPKRTQDLYTALITSLSENTSQLKQMDLIVNLPRIIVDNYLNVHQSFYDQEVIENAIESVIQNNKFKPLPIVGLLLQINRISYFCPKLLDYIDKQLKQCVDFTTLPKRLVFSFVMSCSNCSYKPPHWNTYEQKLLSFMNENQLHTINLSKRLTSDLLILNCWPKLLVEHCLQDDLWRETLDVEEEWRRFDCYALLFVYQAVKLLYSSYYTGSYPSASIIDEMASFLYTNREYPLQDALERGLSGRQYVLSNVRTKLGQHIDYLIVKCKTGELYPINEEKTAGNSVISYESLRIPEDSYPIAIVLLKPSAYCLDGVRMRGRTRLKLRCFEIYGITPIHISYYEWLKLEDDEKMPYLICRIDESMPVLTRGKVR